MQTSNTGRTDTYCWQTKPISCAHWSSIDSGCDYGHYTCQLPGHELAGHPLTCTVSGCESKLRILRAASPHYPKLCRFLAALHESIRNHKHILSLDQALQSGDFEMLVKLCYDDDYQKILSSATVMDTSSNVSGIQDAPIGLQQLKLPDLEADLYLGYAEMIANLEEKQSDDAEFACCSCERLHQRKQVTAFKFSDKIFSSDIWRTLKVIHVSTRVKCCRADALRVSVLQTYTQ